MVFQPVQKHNQAIVYWRFTLIPIAKPMNSSNNLLLFFDTRTWEEFEEEGCAYWDRTMTITKYHGSHYCMGRQAHCYCQHWIGRKMLWLTHPHTINWASRDSINRFTRVHINTHRIFVTDAVVTIAAAIKTILVERDGVFTRYQWREKKIPGWLRNSKKTLFKYGELQELCVFLPGLSFTVWIVHVHW